MPNRMLISLLLAFVSCESPTGDSVMAVSKGTTVATPKTKIVAQAKLDTAQFAVLKFNVKDDYLFKDAQPASLSDDEISQAQQLLAKCIRDFNVVQEAEFQKMVEAFPKIPWQKNNYIISLPNYRRQFIPVTNSKGDKEVWVNCFCADESYWRTQVVSVDDGGNCYFNVKINLTKSLCYDLMVNGSA